MARLSRKQIDLYVGAFVLFAVAAVIFIALRAANITDVATERAYSLTVIFDDIGGLSKRAPVKSSGVRVGQVRAVAYNDEDYHAEVEVVIDQQYQFPADSIFSIVSGNLLGGQYIAIEVGGEDEMLAADDVLYGESAIVLESLISKFLFDEAGE